MKNRCYKTNLHLGGVMTNKLRVLNSEDKRDPLDSYFECITACSWVGGEDVECVTRCVEVHLKEGAQ